MSGTFTYSNPQSPGAGQTTETLTTGGSYTITAIGGTGGAAAVASGGAAASVTDTFNLAPGTVLTFVVGGTGGSPSSPNGGGGGGGGTFVFETPSGGDTLIPLLIAGGGGGAGGGSTGTAGGSALQTYSGAGLAGGGNGGGGGGSYYGGNGAGAGNTGTGGTTNTSAPFPYNGGTGYSNVTTATNSGNGGYGGGGGGGYTGGGGGGGRPGGDGGAGSTSGAGGQAGGSFDSGSSETFAAVADGNGEVIVAMASPGTGPLCFLRGTRILTPTGEVRVEDLQLGDAVVTRFGGIQPVKWIGRHSPAPDNGVNTPVCIHAAALGERLPARDLYVSPGHSLLVDGSLLIASLLVNGVTVTQSWCPPRIDYFHVELATHDCVIAEGAWAETYADAQISRDRFANAAEYDLLYPEAGPAPDAFTLCAPRPEQGAKLEAALRPVLARVAVTPGPLQGSIDRIDGAWRVQGWAHDPAHPDLPVLLEVELDGQVIGTVAACEQRDDLAQAGFARGRCAFTFTSPVRLRPERLHSLRIRRAADGASLAMDARCAAAIPPFQQPEAATARLRIVA